MTLCLIFILNHPKVLIHQLAYKPWAHQEHSLFYFTCFLPQSTKDSSSSRNQATRKQGTTLPCFLPSIAVTEMSQCLLIVTSLQGHRGGPTQSKWRCKRLCGVTIPPHPAGVSLWPMGWGQPCEVSIGQRRCVGEVLGRGGKDLSKPPSPSDMLQECYLDQCQPEFMAFSHFIPLSVTPVTLRVI